MLSHGIGSTPLVEVRSLPASAPRILVKLEQANPGGSIKDRIAWTMIEEAERRGDLSPGMSIVESSSGNTAIGLAMVGAWKGYHVYAICDRNVPAAKLARIAALGGQVVYLPATPPGFDTVDLRIAVAERLAATSQDMITTAQFSNEDNPLSHERSTGPEIWEQTRGQVTGVVAAVGTCGTITGIARYLKSRNRNIAVRAVEPVGSIIFGGRRANYLIQGGGLSFTPTILDKSLVDESTHVSDADAVAAIYRFARTNGILVGGTAGWVLHRLYELARTGAAGETIVGILPDGGDRYLDTIYDSAWTAAHGFNVGPPAETPEKLREHLEELDCSIGRYDETVPGDIEGLYAAMGMPVPDLLTNA